MKTFTCIVCPVGCKLEVTQDAAAPQGYRVTGNRCARGPRYAVEEMTCPKRTVTSTVPMVGGGWMPVRTADSVPKESIDRVLAAMRSIVAPREAQLGDVLAGDIAGTGVNVIACDDGPASAWKPQAAQHNQ
nr:DUF1667 domain-containing protein [bacterium]